jgi:hypothetical protein
MRMRLVKVLFGYGSGTLTGGKLVITDSVTTLTLYVPAAGPLELAPEFQGAPGKPITVTLAAGGSGVSGSVNALFTID